MAQARSSEESEWLVFTQAELGFLSRAILTRRVECPWDDGALAERLDERVRRALGQPVDGETLRVVIPPQADPRAQRH